jgi:diadenosine tetraphosphate (Ap4A) HIT family hydrolase
MRTFEDISDKQVLYNSNNFYIVKDSFPVSPGHMLIISKAHKKTYFDLNDEDVFELNKLILKSKELIEHEFEPDGYNIGMNCGEAAGQTVSQFHCHVILVMLET